MSSLVTSAPGKLLLGGEYAVLDGAPAIAMAVNRRAIVTVDTSAVSNSVSIAGESAAASTFEVRRDGLAWVSGGRGMRLFEAAWNSSIVPARAPVSLLLDTRGFRDPRSDTKYGLGSSAALAAALSVALERLGGGAAADVAHEAHRQYQGGRGSGVDVACSLAGGIIEYRMAGKATRLGWPAGLECAVLWSRCASDTRVKLDQLAGQARQASSGQLAEASESLVAEFRRGAAANTLESLRGYVEALARFDVDHGLGIFDAGHGTMARAGAEFDVVYKPCGAGGGDSGIALSADPDALRAFVEFAEGQGFAELAVGPDPLGAVVEPEYCG